MRSCICGCGYCSSKQQPGSEVQEELIEKLPSARVAHVGQEVEGVRGRTDVGRGQDASGCVGLVGRWRCLLRTTGAAWTQ